MKKLLFILVVIATVLSLPSCFGTRTAVGNYAQEVRVKQEEYKYSRGKQVYLLWGLIPLGRKQVAIPEHTPYQIRTRMNVADLLVFWLTAGIVDMQTIQVWAPLNRTTPASTDYQKGTYNTEYPNTAPADINAVPDTTPVAAL